MSRQRATYTGLIDCVSGCYVCGGSEYKWHGSNAMAVAARHHDATGHTTWVEQTIGVRYGRTKPEDIPGAFIPRDQVGEAQG